MLFRALEIPTGEATTMDDDLKKEFFHTVEGNSVDKLQEFVNQHGLEVATILAKSCNFSNETPLIVAMDNQENNFEMVKFLVDTLNAPVDQLGDFMWSIDDEEEDSEQGLAPPLFCAHIYSENPNSIVNLLIDKELSISEEHPVLNSVLASSTIDRLQKITILELIGAAYILKKPELEKTHQWGLLCWIEALLLREQQPGLAAVQKVPGSLDHIFRQVFGTASEFTTFQELTEMMVNEQFDLMELQALFVVQRLFDEYELDLDPFHANLIKEIWIVKSNENL